MGMGWDKLLTWIGMELADLGLTELDPKLGTAQPLLVLVPIEKLGRHPPLKSVR